MTNINKNGYYVYRFKNKDGTVIYVGRTNNLKKRFLNHEHLTKEVYVIEYIKCNTYADMIIKEVYYINYFYNDLSKNVSDVYDHVSDFKLNDKWINYYCKSVNFDENITFQIELRNNYYKNIINEFNSVNCKLFKNIDILDNEKMNSIGNDKFALSNAWYNKLENKKSIAKLKNNISNYFKNITKASSKMVMWTCTNDYYEKLKGKGYTKGYVDMFYKFNTYSSTRTCLAYLDNIFLTDEQFKYLNEVYGIQSKEEFSLMHIVSFIFRSALRDGKQIQIYIPSKRMRNLLIEWLKNKLE